MKTQKKILVTGGCGAIGQNLVKKLSEEGIYNIYVLDDLSSSKALPPMRNVEFVHMSIANNEKLTPLLKELKPNFIFHLAAHFANQNSVDYPVSDIMSNILGFVHLLESQRTNHELEKIVYSSSSCVYGNIEFMEEDTNVLPYETPYAINKYVGELYCKYYSEIHKLPTVCVRIFNTFGPGEYPGEYRNVIPNFIAKALKNKPLVITGTGNETRDFTFVDNTVDLLCKSAFSDYRNGEVFNGGTGVVQKVKDIAKMIIKHTNSKSEIILTASRSWDHVNDRRSDISKSKESLGYSPVIDIENQLKVTCDWMRNELEKNQHTI